MRLLLLFDRIAFWLFFAGRYRRMFGAYGRNVRWGAHGRRLVIPRSIRISCPEKIRIGNNCQIDEGVYLQCHAEGEGIQIGDGTRINAHTHLLAFSKITLGNDVLIAPFSLLASGDHGHARSDRAVMHQHYERSGPIVVGDGAWIGHGAKLLGGATIGRNSVVGAGAVVKGQFGDHSLLLGVPARCRR